MEELDFNPVGNIQSATDIPYLTSGDLEMGYSDSPVSAPQIQLYKPNYNDAGSSFVNNLRVEALNGLYSKQGGDTFSNIVSQSTNKIDISGGYVRANDAYERLSDGTLLPKYEMYKPGINNEEYNASLQSNTEKFFNPILRGNIKVGRGIFADIGSFVYGVGEAVVTGRAESLFDNSMSNWVDDLDKKTDFAYKNYYTEAQNGLGANLYTWDKVLGGAEFTARMLGAEAVIAVATGGTSLPSSFARAGARLGLTASKLSRGTRALRVAETLEDVAEIGRDASRITRIMTEPVSTVARQGGGVFSAERYARGLESAISGGKLADNLKQARFAVTGSAYEAGFEARHYQNEAENSFWEYHRSKGTEPTTQEVAEFQDKLDTTTWGVFGANMAILSVSNMALFGNMLNIKNPFPKLATNSFFDRAIFKIGTEKTAEGIWRPLKSNFFNKALAYSSPIAKGAFTEGVFEEGGQGIASGMMKNYMASTYDPKAMKETADYSSAFTKAFKDQYSTKEGLEEVVIGGIIGGLFGGVGGIRQTSAKYKNQEFVSQVQNAMPQVAENIVNNLYTNENLSNIFGHSNRIQNINERIEESKSKGDVTGSALHSAESFISMLQASASVGKTDEFMTTLKESLRGMDASKLAEGQNISLENVEAFKAEKIAGVEALSENYTKAREAGSYIFGQGRIGGFYEVDGKKVNRQNLIDGFAYTSAMGAVSQQIAGDSFNAFQQKLADVGTSREITEQFGAIGALQSAGQLELARYTQATQEENRLKKQQQRVTDEIIRTQRSEQTPQTAEKLSNLNEQLINLSQEISDSTKNRELYWKSIADNFYRNLGQSEGGFLPQINFDNFQNQTKDLQGFLSGATISEFDKLELNKLLEEFNKANSAFKSFNSLANSLADKNFTFKTYSNLFAGARAKNDASLNELTKETLINLYNTDTKVGETISSFQPTPSIVTDEVLIAMEAEDYVLPNDVLTVLADKVKNNQTLTANETKVYDNFKDNIDSVANRVIEDPINETGEETNISTTTVEITARKNELKQLRKGILTPAIQSEINRIDAEIQKLQEETTNNTSSIDDVKSKLGDIGNQRLFDDFIRLLNNARDNMSQSDIDLLITNLKNDSVAIVGGTTDTLRNNVERGDLDSAWIENPNNLEGDYFQEFETALSKLFSWITADNNTRQQPETANSIETDKLNERVGTHSNPIFVGDIVLNILRGENNSVDNTSEIEKFEQAKSELVTDRIEDLETEIEELKFKDSADKKLIRRKENLSMKISNLRSQILMEISENNIEDLKLDTKQPYYSKLRAMRRAERQLRDLNNIKQEFNPNATYREQLQWVVDNSNTLDYENVETLSQVSPPNEQDVERFSELDGKKRKTKAETAEYNELREKLLPYRLVEGSFFGGIPLIDIIEVYNQSMEQGSVEDNQVQRLPEFEVQRGIDKVQKPETDPEYRAPDVGLVYDGVYVKGAVGNQSIHHIRLNTMFENAMRQNLPITVTEYTVDDNGTETYADSQTVDGLNVEEMGRKYDNFQGVVINIGDDIVLEKSPRGSYFVSRKADILPFLNLQAYAITGQPNAYNLIYSENSDGTFTPKESEYEVVRDGVIVPFDKETLNSLKAGDNVTLFYDPNDSYNRTLSKKDRVNKGNIYVMKSGNLVNILKAVPQYKDKGEGWASLADLRKNVVENGTATIKVKNSYMGLPNITIGADGKPIELPINEDMVESYGYIDRGGNYNFFNNVNPTNTQYTDPYLEMGKNIPIVAFTYNGKIYTFPITVDSVSVDATAQLDTILENEDLNEYQRILQVNSLLNSHNLMTDELRLTNQNDTIEAIREALTTAGERIDITNKEDVQNAPKSILLDMNDPFMSAKLVLDLKSAPDILDEMDNKTKDEKIEPISDVGIDLADENKC